MKQHILTRSKDSILDTLLREQKALRRIVVVASINKTAYVVIVEDTPESIAKQQHEEHMLRGDF